MILLLALLACAKDIPPHLQVDRPAAQVTATTRPMELVDLVRNDPLVRRPDPGAEGDWTGLPDGAAIEAWSAQARNPRATSADWAEVEQTHRGTTAVPLARGARLAALEVALAGEIDEAGQQQVAAWLGATRVEARPTTDNARGPLDWIPGVTMADKRDAALVMAERTVLLGWMDGPNIDVEPAALALTQPGHSRMLDTPTGTLIRARAAREHSENAGLGGRAALNEASVLALATVGADRDAEQEVLKRRLANAQEALGHTEDPIRTGLHRARISLTADAGNNVSAGLALVSLTAERLFRTCPEGQCAGLDRTQVLESAARWGPEVRAMARVWQVIALKQAVDTLVASHNKPSFGHSLIDVVDPLSGTGGGSIELSLMRYRTAEPTALLQISRLAQGPATTDSVEVIGAVKARLVRACDAALAERQSRPVINEIRRIRDRARRP